MMARNIYPWLRWICAPTGVTTFVGFCLFLVSMLLAMIMATYFNGVIGDNDAMNDNPMVKMVNDADAFMKQLKNNASGHGLLNDYQWLHHFDMLVRANCNIVSVNLKRLRYTGYAMAVYNTILMHILLNGILPVSLMSCIPIFASVISNYIDQSMIILLGCFEFTQVVLSIVIFGAFVILNEKIKSQRRHQDYEE